MSLEASQEGVVEMRLLWRIQFGHDLLERSEGDPTVDQIKDENAGNRVT